MCDGKEIEYDQVAYFDYIETKQLLIWWQSRNASIAKWKKATNEWATEKEKA